MGYGRGGWKLDQDTHTLDERDAARDESATHCCTDLVLALICPSDPIQAPWQLAVAVGRLYFSILSIQTSPRFSLYFFPLPSRAYHLALPCASSAVSSSSCSNVPFPGL